MEKFIKEEIIKCQDPVYFYCKYLKIKAVNGEWVVPPPLTEDMKLRMREWVGYKPENKQQ